MSDYTELSLGETIYEAAPWDGKVLRRQVVRIETYEQYDTVIDKVKKSVRKFFASGGILGIGDEINKSTWGKKYFPDPEMARRVCVEQAVKIKQERREQLEEEIKSLQNELEDESPA